MQGCGAASQSWVRGSGSRARTGCCWLEAPGPRLIGRSIPADIDQRWCALENVDLLCPFAQVTDDSASSGACPDDADMLVFEFVQTSRRINAGVVKVPPRGVPFKLVNFFKPRQLRSVHTAMALPQE